MIRYSIILCLIFLGTNTFAKRKRNIHQKPINVTGSYNQDSEREDAELVSLQTELDNQQTMKERYQEKATLYKDLKGATKKLIKSHRKYAKNKYKYEKFLTEFNDTTRISICDNFTFYQNPQCHQCMIIGVLFSRLVTLLRNLNIVILLYAKEPFVFPSCTK